MRAALSLIATLSLLATECSGHYIFQQLTVNNKKFAVYEHIRKNTNYNSPVTSMFPLPPAGLIAGAARY